ncbi:MAG: hypothetical protein JST75_19675 [Bacteroidetes bacterium]|nr:hypothetical protein [Bacteroidota bacterium]
MKKQFLGKDAMFVVIVFLISRLILSYFGVRMDYKAIFEYWQYLDIESLKNNLLKATWYDHAQPPFFNLLLGTVVKLSCNSAPIVFELLFKLITLINCLLLLDMLKKVTAQAYLPLILTMIYLLSPATMLFESELFYTTFISMLLLVSTYFIFSFRKTPTIKNSFGIFIPLAILCLTRSMYHLVWLVVITTIILIYYKNKNGFKQLLTGGVIAFVLVTGWYIKNYIIFGNFGSSTWIGMNMARNVFHDNDMMDSTRIESIEPFSQISYYKKFVSGDYEKRYKGINDRDLMQEFKNDSFINENHIDYIEVSKKYMDASKQYMKSHPVAYVKNVLQSGIIFFTSASVYPLAVKPSQKIKYYDIICGFNLTHFANSKQQRRILLTISAIPKFFIYLVVFYFLARTAIQKRKERFFGMELFNVVIICTIAFVFSVSSLLEHFENMRFRYEIEPLFIILLVQVISEIIQKRRTLQ